MFLASFASGPWQANCYLVAPDAGRECVIIDAGMEAADSVRGLVAEHGLTPAGVIATHGHLDHVAAAALLADEFGTPLWIHPADRHLLTDPGASWGDDPERVLERFYPGPHRESADVRPLGTEDGLAVAGLEFSLTPAPGHTAGCVLLGLPYPGHDQVRSVVFSGDVLFAGAIGRTDLPGGDPEAMRETLIGPVLSLPDDAAILPGHGGQTVMARERALNPYLQPAFLRN